MRFLTQDPIARLYSGLPRLAPGSDNSTLRALGCLGTLGEQTRVLDLGNGSGGPALTLAKSLNTPVTAVGIHMDYLEQLEARASCCDLDHLVEIVQADIAKIDYPPGSFDLIWAEGTARTVGFERALEAWRPLLAENGTMVVSELCWQEWEPNDEVRKFWTREYPEMTDVAGNHERAAASGMRVVDWFTLPLEDWWNDFYDPLSFRVEELRPFWNNNEELKALLDETEQEIDLYRRHGESYGYTFFIMKDNG